MTSGRVVLTAFCDTLQLTSYIGMNRAQLFFRFGSAIPRVRHPQPKIFRYAGINRGSGGGLS